MASAARATQQLKQAEALVKRFRVRALQPQWHPLPHTPKPVAAPVALTKTAAKGLSSKKKKGAASQTKVPQPKAKVETVPPTAAQLLPDASNGARKGWLQHDPRVRPSLGTTAQAINPFLPTRVGGTGKVGHWRAPRMSLRRQADLVKAAKAAGLLHLLPPGPKNPVPKQGQEKYWRYADRKANEDREKLEKELKEAQDVRVSHGRKRKEVKVRLVGWNERVQWVGEVPARKGVPGARLYAHKKRMFKGHRWERVRPRVEARRSLVMRDMSKRIRRFKSVSRLLRLFVFHTLFTRFLSVSQASPSKPAQAVQLCQGAQVAVLNLILGIDTSTFPMHCIPNFILLATRGLLVVSTLKEHRGIAWTTHAHPSTTRLSRALEELIPDNPGCLIPAAFLKHQVLNHPLRIAI